MSRRSRARTRVLPVKALVIAVLAVVIVLVGVAAALHFGLLGKGGSDESQVAITAQQFVKAKLGGSLHFASMAETYVDKTEDGKTRVNGSVTQVAPSGRTSSYSYTVLMHPSQEDGSWIVDDVSLIPT